MLKKKIILALCVIMLVLIGCVFVSSKENEELSSLATILKSEKKFASSNYLNVEPISYDDDEESYLVITKDSSAGAALVARLKKLI